MWVVFARPENVVEPGTRRGIVLVDRPFVDAVDVDVGDAADGAHRVLVSHRGPGERKSRGCGRRDRAGVVAARRVEVVDFRPLVRSLPVVVVLEDRSGVTGSLIPLARKASWEMNVLLETEFLVLLFAIVIVWFPVPKPV